METKIMIYIFYNIHNYQQLNVYEQLNDRREKNVMVYDRDDDMSLRETTATSGRPLFVDQV